MDLKPYLLDYAGNVLLSGCFRRHVCVSVSSIRESESMRENLTSNLKFCDVAKKGDPKFRYQLTTQNYDDFLSKN